MVTVKEKEKEVANLLCNLGISRRNRGYRYLKDSVLLCLKNPEALCSITKVLYPTVAKSYNATPVSVERTMRYAIECAWDSNQATMETYFSGDKRPVVSEFIATMVDAIKYN